MSKREPGFYVKMAVCDAEGNDVYTVISTKFRTAREFYEKRLIPANVSRTYSLLSEFMCRVSVAVSVVDALTIHARLGPGKVKPRLEPEPEPEIEPDTKPKSIREPTLKNVIPQVYDPEVHTSKTRAIRVKRD